MPASAAGFATINAYFYGIEWCEWCELWSRLACLAGMPSVLRAARVRHKNTRRRSHRIGRPRFMTRNGPTELAHNPARIDGDSRFVDILCVSASSLQPVSSRRFQHRFLRAVCSPGAKTSRSLAVYSPLDALQRRGAKKQRERRTARRDAVDASPSTPLTHTPPSPRAPALTVHRSRRSVTGLNTFGSARRDQTATDVAIL